MNCRIFKRLTIVLLFFAVCNLQAQRLTFPDNLSYDPFFSILVTDSEGTEYDINNASFRPMENQESFPDKFFFLIRRGTNQGIATYVINFNKVQQIRFNDDYEYAPPGYTPAEILLTSDEIYQGYIYTNGYLVGLDTDFGTPVHLYLHYNLINSIQFRHDGTYKICPYCGTIFYETPLRLCPFDDTELLPQNTRE